MRLKKYSSDLSARSWQVIEKLIVVQRQSKWDLHQVVNAILYLTKNGCVWRDIPGEFPPWETVYWYYRKWVKDGTWKNINACLTADCREKQGRPVQPTAVIIDSQSVKGSNTCTEAVGVDGGKRVRGRKRFFITDTLGNLVESFVVAANCHDGTSAARRWEGLAVGNELLDRVELVYADGTFGGVFRTCLQENHSITVEIPKLAVARKGSVEIHPKRWVVERTIAWTVANRRLAKDYERKTDNANAYVQIASIRRMARRI
jgi:putative transposase